VKPPLTLTLCLKNASCYCYILVIIRHIMFTVVSLFVWDASSAKSLKRIWLKFSTVTEPHGGLSRTFCSHSGGDFPSTSARGAENMVCLGRQPYIFIRSERAASKKTNNKKQRQTNINKEDGASCWRHMPMTQNI